MPISELHLAELSILDLLFYSLRKGFILSMLPGAGSWKVRTDSSYSFVLEPYR